MGGLLAKILTELLDVLGIAVVVCSRKLIWDFYFADSRHRCPWQLAESMEHILAGHILGDAAILLVPKCMAANEIAEIQE